LGKQVGEDDIAVGFKEAICGYVNFINVMQRGRNFVLTPTNLTFKTEDIISQLVSQ
jgi:hypothetical protein